MRFRLVPFLTPWVHPNPPKWWVELGAKIDSGIPAKRRQMEQNFVLRGIWKVMGGLLIGVNPNPLTLPYPRLGISTLITATWWQMEQHFELIIIVKSSELQLPQIIQLFRIKVCRLKNLRAHQRPSSHNLWAFLVAITSRTESEMYSLWSEKRVIWEVNHDCSICLSKKGELLQIHPERLSWMNCKSVAGAEGEKGSDVNVD